MVEDVVSDNMVMVDDGAHNCHNHFIYKINNTDSNSITK
jgi:hypothetical protein